jgi:hypothetical protein
VAFYNISLLTPHSLGANCNIPFPERYYSPRVLLTPHFLGADDNRILVRLTVYRLLLPVIRFVELLCYALGTNSTNAQFVIHRKLQSHRMSYNATVTNA